MVPAKTVLSVHDLSGVGRCALTVVLPTVAAAGFQPIPLPTAVLSTHTGGFTHIAKVGLTDFMRDCLRHWDEMGLAFDAIYTGYLADPLQGEVVEELMSSARRRKPDVFVMVDPAMGDEGRLYNGLSSEMPAVMRRLCAMADLVVPNITEARLLLGEDPALPVRDEDEALSLARRLGGDRCVITGVKVGDVHANVAGGHVLPFAACPGEYPGTGDLFASVLLTRVLKGEPLVSSVAFASSFVSEVVADTAAMGTEMRMGLQFESKLRKLFP